MSGLGQQSSLLFLAFADDEPAGAGVDGGDEEEEDVEDDERLDLVDGHPRLDVELRQRALPRDDLADNGEGHAQLRQPTHEQLVRLGESKQRPCIACTKMFKSTNKRRQPAVKCLQDVVCRDFYYYFFFYLPR